MKLKLLLVGALAGVLAGCASSSGGSGGDAAHVAAIQAVITRTSNPSDGFVVFEDISDQARDGKSRVVQMSCDDKECHFEALCDDASLPCTQVGSKLAARGLKKDPKIPGVYFLDRKGNHHDFAVLTDDIYRNVFNAAAGYKLTWRSNIQTNAAPV